MVLNYVYNCREARSLHRDRVETGFTLIEILVVLAILMALSAILFPVFAGVREQGRRTTCVSNLRQIGAALATYVQDNEGVYPPQSVKAEGWPGVKTWTGIVASYAPAAELFRCPSAEIPANLGDTTYVTSRGYAINAALYDYDNKGTALAIPETRVRFPALTVAVCEFAYRTRPRDGAIIHADALSAPDDGMDLEPDQHYVGSAGALRHNNGSNFAFVDGHVHWYPPAQVTGQKFNAKQVSDGRQPGFAAL